MSAEANHAAQANTTRAKVSEAYAEHSRESEEQKWIVDNLPLVRHIAQKIISQLSSRTDLDDLIAAGTLGLVKAARAYDQSREAEFRTYAYIRVRGAIIDELRGRSFVPSSVRKQIRRIQQAYQKYSSAHGLTPTDEQLAAEVGISPAQLYRTLQEARKQNFLSIHGLSEESPLMGGFLPQSREARPDEQAERKEMLEKMAQAISELPKRDRLILLLYYERDLTMKEAAEVLGITESRVSQLHAGALFKLSMKLKPRTAR